MHFLTLPLNLCIVTSSEDTDQDFQSKQSKLSLKPKKISFCRVSGDPQLALQIPPQTIEETVEQENDQLSILSNESSSSKSPSKQASLPVDVFFNEDKTNNTKFRHCPKSMAVRTEKEGKLEKEEEESKKVVVVEEERLGKIRNTITKRIMGEGSIDLEKSYLHDLGKSIVALNYTHKITDKLQKYKTMKDKLEGKREEGGETKEGAEIEDEAGGVCRVKEEEPSFSAADLKFVPVKNFVISKLTIEEDLGEINKEKKKSEVEIGKELFENFFIIGTDKEEIMKEGDKARNEKSLTLMSKIVYDFKKTDDDKLKSLFFDFVLFYFFLYEN